jgi:hypothetical protein
MLERMLPCVGCGAQAGGVLSGRRSYHPWLGCRVLGVIVTEKAMMLSYATK